MDFLEVFLRVILFVPIVWIAFFLTTTVHETGHMIGYLLCAKKRATNWHIIAGRGRQLMRIGRLIICLIPRGGGVAPKILCKVKIGSAENFV